jgi:predicted CXXCH cytochrome family protein
MKRLGRVLSSFLAVALTVFSLQSFAAAQMGGRDFNHMTTGFILSGGHAVAACETCHIGGVFKGTPRACDGCHAVGRRIIATPKTNSHIVTDAPCESCHFNTATWLGARYNHGTAVQGQCATCHNGRLSFAKPATHNAGSKATKSCDSCHRSSAWLPASWNHTLSPGVCSTCHTNAGMVSSPNLKPAAHAAPAIKGTEACDACHTYTGWYPNRFKHNTGGTCSSCHLNAVKAVGQPTSHNSFAGWPTECNECHTTTSWSGALGGKPANHIPYTSGTCVSCHTGSTTKTGATLHAYVSTVCTTCHLSGTSYLGSMDKKGIGHEGMKTGDDCSKSGCHKPAGSRGTAYINWD